MSMEWLWGSRGNSSAPVVPQNFTDLIAPPTSGGGEDGKKPSGNLFGFDAEAFERAAVAVKSLENNAHAKDVFSVVKEQQITKQKEVEIQVLQMKQQLSAAEYEKKRQMLQEQAQLDKQKAEYNDQLHRRRSQEQLAQQQKHHEEVLRKQEESQARQDAQALQRLKAEYDGKTKHEVAVAKAKVEATAKEERANKDMRFEELLLKTGENRKTLIETVSTLTGSLGYGVDAFLTNKDKLFTFGAGIVCISAGYYGVKHLNRVAFNYLESKIMTPSMVQETSRVSPIDFVLHPIKTARKFKKSTKDVMDGIIMEPKLEARVRDIAITAQNTLKNKGYQTNLLLYGPPGTGKTLFAKSLSKYSGMDYAILSGGDLAYRGKAGVEELNKVLSWADRSRNGVIIFVDEAEPLLAKRSTMSEEMKVILSPFLQRTGQVSKKYLFIFATNTPEVLDEAVMSRTADPVEIGLPGLDERMRLCYLYMDQYIFQSIKSGGGRLKVGDFDHQKVCSDVARLTEDFSGRDISNLFLNCQKTAVSSKDGVCTQDIILERTRFAVQMKQVKNNWLKEQKLREQGFSQQVINEASKNFSK